MTNNDQTVDSQPERDQVALQKEVAYYSAFVQAWIENRMEVDKQLLTLSTLGIGLLVTFFTGQSGLENVAQFVVWLIAGFMFVLTIIMTLLIFQRNANYIVCIISDSDDTQKKSLESFLQYTTICAFWTFLIGLVLTFTLAIMKSHFMLTKIGG